MDEIKDIRKKIDKIDNDIKKLLEERLNCLKSLKKIKKIKKLKIHQPEREKEILNSIKNPYIKSIYKKILQESRELQQSL